MKINTLMKVAVAGALAVAAQSSFADCSQLNYTAIKTAALAAAATGNDAGYPLNFWVTAVDETGKVCAVYTNGVPGANAGNSEWLGSRVISAQKANTANAFSLDAYAISTANLWDAVKNGSLYGLQHSNPVDASRAYQGNPANYGKANDPLVGSRIGGVNVFGGGLAVYKAGKKVGAIGVSGDTSCADHIFAWNVRTELGMTPSAQQTGGLAGPGTGITTVNFDAAGNAVSKLTGATDGDELILKSGQPTETYWDAWAQPACPNSAAGTTGVLTQ